jgi:hypothetical protein
MKKLLFILLVMSFSITTAQMLYNDPDTEKGQVALIYGQHHLFSVMTPKDWVINKPYARTLGLASYFYPENAIDKNQVYLYAMGYDKSSPQDTLEDFIKSDIKNIKKSFPKAITKELKLTIKFTGPIIRGKVYEFLNYADKYGDQIVYIETKESILTIVYSAKTQEDYKKYLGYLDEMIGSFQYLGNSNSDSEKGQVTLIHGRHHLFSVMPPKGWVINKPYARQLGLASFFYPENAIDKNQVYLYAMGFDKTNSKQTLSQFIKDDVDNIKINNSLINIKEVKLKIKFAEPILGGKIYEFLNFSNKYGYQVIYIETKESILTIVYSAKTEEDYKKYLSCFDEIIGSFQYLGNN